MFTMIRQFVLLAFCCVVSSTSYAAGLAQNELIKYANVDSIRVIVELSRNSPNLRNPSNSSPLDSPLDAKSRVARTNDLLSLRGKLGVGRNKNGRTSTREILEFDNPNIYALTVNQSGLAALVNDASIDVYEDKLNWPLLSSSVPLVFPTQSTSQYSGTSWSVAVLDSGVDKTHPFLTGRIVGAAEACFSYNDTSISGNSDFASLCPNGQQQQVGAGSGTAGTGTPCSPSKTGCDHGTKMAGVIAGNVATVSGNTQNGVSLGASIIPVQVGTEILDTDLCPNPPNSCIAFFDSDIIKGLEYVRNISGSHSIAAVNLSIGSQIAGAQGPCNGVNPGLTTAINNLVNVGVAVVAAAGNNASQLGVSSPACISTAFAVAATDAASGSTQDDPWINNNRSSATLDLFAPGVAVTTSTLPSPQYVAETGTSIAAAHVSGAWAVLRNKNSALSVSQMAAVFKSVGPLIVQTPVIKRRLNIEAALAAVQEATADEGFCFPIITSSSKVATICL